MYTNRGDTLMAKSYGKRRKGRHQSTHSNTWAYGKDVKNGQVFSMDEGNTWVKKVDGGFYYLAEGLFFGGELPNDDLVLMRSTSS